MQATEVAQSVDLSRGKEPFLTVVVEISGGDAARLRRVQPLRDDFQLQAGKTALSCRWLRGGSVPDDPNRLRFTLGFRMPAASVKTVTLVANLPRLEGEDALEVRLTGLKPGVSTEELSGPGWRLRVNRFAEAEYVPPALPPKGQFYSKAGPVDARVFRKTGPSDPVPPRVFVLQFHTPDLGLYDPILDVTGSLLVDGGPATPLLSALFKRDPSRTVENPLYGPYVSGELHFRLPEKGRANGVVLRLERRPARPASQPVRLEGLPVPGR